MRKTITLSALLVAGLMVPAIVHASDDNRCASRTSGTSVAANEVRERLEGLGYRVERIEAEHGCYEVRAANDSGFPIKALYSQVTGELLGAKLH